MSWFNQASLSSFAKTALSSAQKSIDKVLDIQDEEGSDTGSGTQTAQSSGGTGRASSLSNPGSASVLRSLSGKLQSNSEEDGTLGQEEIAGSEAYSSQAKSQVSPEDDTFFSAFLTGNEPPSKPKKSLGKKLQTPAKSEDVAKESPTDKHTRLSSMSGKNSKTKSKILLLDSDDSDEIDKERRTSKSGKKSHLGSRKADSKEVKSEAVLQPLHVDVGQPEPVLPPSTAPAEDVLGSTKDDSKQDASFQETKTEDSAINPEIVKSTESFLLVKSSDVRELEEENDTLVDQPLGQNLESSNSTSTGTVEAEEKEGKHHISSRRKSSDLDTKSESENTDEQTSIRSDSDFVVINEHTASEQSSVYLYDTRESPENTSPKHYSSSSNGKRSPTDSDFSIISEGRFNDMPDPMHAGAQSQDVGNIVEQASMALSHRVSPSYSADVESEDQDDKMTPSSSTDERPRSSSEEGLGIREEHNSTPTPKESESQESLPQAEQEEETPRPENEGTLKTTSPDTAEEYDQNSATQPQKLLKKLAEMALVLEARESQIIHLSQQNGELQESVTDLKSQVAVSEEKRKNETYDLHNLTDEFTQRISSMEKKLQMANRERDQFKKDSQKMQKALNDIEKNDATGKLLAEKDEQISELMVEGEKLSKQQLQNSNVIKKLRAKEKETDRLLNSQKEQLDKAEARISHLEQVLDGKEDVEKKQKDAIKTLNSAVEKQEKEILNLKSELEDGREKVRSTQHALDASYKEIAELHRSIASKQSMVQETALSAEMNAKEELKLALDRSQLEARRQHEGLLLQVNDLQLSLNRADQQNARKEDSFRQEISDLQQRLQESEARNQELSQSVTAATRPLLRQIENLQATFNAQSSSWEQVERSLTERLSDAQTQLVVSTEKERGAQEMALEASSKVAALESQLAMLRQEKSRLSALLEMEKARLESLEESKIRDFSHMENQLQNYLRSVEEAQQEKSNLEKQLNIERIKVETERKKLSLTQEALEEKERRLQQAEDNSGSPSPSSRASTPVHSEIRPSFITSISRTPSQGEILERTMSMSMTGSVYDNILSSSSTSIIESLQSQLKQREGEISQLQSEIYQLERTRSSMAEEIVKLTNQTDRLEEEVSYIPELRIQQKDLQHRYNAVLQMYGEKAEEVQELKLDLQDVKEMYRQQIEDLIRGST